jgi:hypothetical protein
MAEPRTVPRWLIVLAVAVSILVAAFTGFRVPNAWTATHDTVSLIDGFHRRFVVGTLLRPFAAASGYDYWLFAGFSFAVLAAVLAVLTIAAARTELLSRRALIIAWLLLPAGGFLFNEVGYFEQVLYLMLFVAIWLVARSRVPSATCLMCITPFVHEIAILTVIPVFGLVALRALPVRRAFAATLPPAILNLLVLAISPASAGAVASLSATLHTANFAPRSDALALFERAQAESWRLYSFQSGIVVVKPVAILLVVAFIALWVTDRGFWRRGPGRIPTPIVLLCSCVAIAAPALLVYGGWDANRWAFMIMSNFFLVLWISLGDRGARELRGSATIVLATTVLLLGHFSLAYFEYRPRDLGTRAMRKLFFRQIKDRSLFDIPQE